MHIEINNVKELVTQLSGLSDEELKGFNALIENIFQSFISSIEDKDGDSSKAELLAAAKINYEIALTNSESDGVTSFKAGDVSITKRGRASAESAKALYLCVLKDCGEFAEDSNFDFRCV